jgi:hypothetical protein
MTQVVSPSDEEIIDFTEHINVKFRIDDDVFIGKKNIPALSLIEFGTMFDGLTESDLMKDSESFNRMFSLVLQKQSAARFFERMGSDDEPIAMTQVMRIIPWIMEKYGMRPTEPSSNSSNGSQNLGDGTSSTVSASPRELTFAGSQPTTS